MFFNRPSLSLLKFVCSWTVIRRKREVNGLLELIRVVEDFVNLVSKVFHSSLFPSWEIICKVVLVYSCFPSDTRVFSTWLTSWFYTVSLVSSLWKGGIQRNNYLQRGLFLFFLLILIYRWPTCSTVNSLTSSCENVSHGVGDCSSYSIARND